MGGLSDHVANHLFAKIYMIACPIFCALFDVVVQTGAASWPLIIIGGLVASTSIIVGFWVEKAPTQSAPGGLDGEPQAAPPAKPRNPIVQSLLTGGLLACFVYLLYQVFLLIQVMVWGEVLPTVNMLQRPTIGATAMVVIMIQTQFFVAIVGIILGAVFLDTSRRLIPGLLAAFLTLVLLTLTAQLIALAMGNTSHLDQLQGVDLATIAQGILLTWSILVGSLAVGAIFARASFYGRRALGSQ